jgi:hypothetical protein
MPIDVQSAYIGYKDDAGDFEYDNFIPRMDEYRINMTLEVG